MISYLVHYQIFGAEQMHDEIGEDYMPWMYSWGSPPPSDTQRLWELFSRWSYLQKSKKSKIRVRRVLDLMKGQRVIGRNEEDGFYYPGKYKELM